MTRQKPLYRDTTRLKPLYREHD